MMCAILSNFLFFMKVPGQQVLPWLNLLLSVAAVVCFVMGLRRAMVQPQVYRGKVGGWVLTVVSSLLLVFAVFGFYASRHIPAATGAPQVGQKAPDFILKDSNGQHVSLQQLISAPMANSGGAAPKAVLLIFYRGYW